jgi:hypothetical protein
MVCHLQNAIDIIDDILSKVDDLKQHTAAPAADRDVQPVGETAAPGEAAAKKPGKKKDKKVKKEAAPAPAATNEQSSDPFTMADLRVRALAFACETCSFKASTVQNIPGCLQSFSVCAFVRHCGRAKRRICTLGHELATPEYGS